MTDFSIPNAGSSFSGGRCFMIIPQERKTMNLVLHLVQQKLITPPAPDENAIRGLLLQCLEAHYGSLDRCIAVPERGGGLAAADPGVD
jgi:hypothetical protein